MRKEAVEPVILGIGSASRKRSAIQVVDSVVISVDENRERARKPAVITCAYLVAWMDERKAEQHGIDVKAKNRYRGTDRER